LPEILVNRTALLTAIDNAQDALSTLAVTGMLAARTLPAGYRAAVLAGSGWIMIAAQCLNLATFGLAPEQIALSRKRMQDRLTKDNPFNKKAKVKLAKRLKKAKVGMGAALEAAQTTKEVFGIGISLGAIMSLPLNVLAGSIRLATGDPLTVIYPVPYVPHWIRRAKKLWPAMLMPLGLYHGTDDMELTTHILAANALSQMDLSHTGFWDPLSYLGSLDQIEIPAPGPEKGYLLEILEETDPDWRDTVVWPSTGKKWSGPNEIAETTYENITNNLHEYFYRQKHSELGFIASQNASQASMNILQKLEGPGSVDTDYTAWSKLIHALLDLGYVPPPDLTDWQKSCFIGWLEAHESAGTCPTIPEAIAFARHNCGFEFERS